jgi:hypothetical protein
MKKNTSNFVIKIVTMVLKFLGNMKCACCNSKCSSTETQNVDINVPELDNKGRLFSNV